MWDRYLRKRAFSSRGLVVVPPSPVDGAEIELCELLAALRVLEQALDLVAGLDRADAGRGARQDEVALLRKRPSAGQGRRKSTRRYLERHNRRDVLDEPRDLEDHVLGVPILFHCAVDLGTPEPHTLSKQMETSDANAAAHLEPEVEVLGIADSRPRNKGASGRFSVKMEVRDSPRRQPT